MFWDKKQVCWGAKSIGFLIVLRRVHTPLFRAIKRVWTLRQIPYLNNIPRPFRARLLIFSDFIQKRTGSKAANQRFG